MSPTTSGLLVLLLAALCSINARPLAVNLSADDKKTLDAHNKLRQQHGAPALSWDPDLAKQAAAFVAKCQFKVEAGLSVGQNLGVTSSSDPAGQLAAMTQTWYDSGSKAYDFRNPGFSMSAGQFTQIVWKATTKIGCAARACDSIGGFGQGGSLVQCRYSPAGNVQGAFGKNVAPAGTGGASPGGD